METRYRFLSNRILELKTQLHTAENTYHSHKDAHARGVVGDRAMRESYEAYFGLKSQLDTLQNEFLQVQTTLFRKVA